MAADRCSWGAGGPCDFRARELIPSWNARTPPGTWLLVEVRVSSDEDGLPWTPWLTLARWVEGDSTLRAKDVQ